MLNRKANPVKLVESGNCKAIDFLIDRQLNPRGRLLDLYLTTGVCEQLENSKGCYQQ